MRCLVPGCGNVRTTGLSIRHKFHIFPSDPVLCSQWLEAIRHPQFTPKFTTVLTTRTHGLRVCSDHFTDDDYQGGQKSYYATLRRGAVPVIFPWSSTESAPPTPLSHQQMMPPMQPREMPLVLRFQLSSPVKALRPRHMPLFRVPGPPGVYTATSPAIDPARCEGSLPDSLASIELGASPQKMSTPHSKRSAKRARMDPSTEESTSSLEGRGPADGTFQPSTVHAGSSDDVSSESSHPSGPSRKEKQWIVYETKLMDLFKFCQHCQQAISDIRKTVQGGVIKIEWECINHHTGEWTSSRATLPISSGEGIDHNHNRTGNNKR
ncbi:peroxynitrite isomerase THAP4-like [Centroberyx affinis]|uniref:peroxynitrite isomerase THAP4-like n=1 Tax=Centroberyx affinis TaxID=166261 RepID=UPI003A5C53F5